MYLIVDISCIMDSPCHGYLMECPGYRRYLLSVIYYYRRRMSGLPADPRLLMIYLPLVCSKWREIGETQ